MRLLLLLIFLPMLGCHRDNDTTKNIPTNVDAKLLFTSSASQLDLGDSIDLVWSGSALVACVASGGWSGNKSPSGSEVLTPLAVGLQTYQLECSTSDANQPVLSKSLQIIIDLVVTPAVISAGDGSDARQSFEHFNQYAN